MIFYPGKPVRRTSDPLEVRHSQFRFVTQQFCTRSSDWELITILKGERV